MKVGLVESSETVEDGASELSVLPSKDFVEPEFVENSFDDISEVS